MRIRNFVALVFISLLLYGLGCAQKPSEPVLVGTWIGGEDFGEFKYHKSALLDSYLKEDPGGKIFIRYCSKLALPEAMVSSTGFGYQFITVNVFRLRPESVFFAIYSKCKGKAEQYWFLPSNTTIEYDKLVAAKAVNVSRWIGDYYPKPTSKAAEKEFRRNVDEYIAQLKSNPRSEGFIILNIHTLTSRLNWALSRIAQSKVTRARFKLIRKRQYKNYYPEFLTVTINN